MEQIVVKQIKMVGKHQLDAASAQWSGYISTGAKGNQKHNSLFPSFFFDCAQS